MTIPPRAAAVIYAKDVARLAAFYGGLLGVVPEHPERGYAVLELPAISLVIVGIPERLATSIEIADPPERREETPVKLVLPVADLAAARAAAPALGGIVDAPDREWTFRGVRVCDGHDPEGNVVQWSEARPWTPRRRGPVRSPAPWPVDQEDWL